MTLADTHTDHTDHTDRADRADVSVGRTALAVLVAVIGSTIAVAVIAVLARGAGASHAFKPLTPSAYLPLTTIGVVAGGIGWHVVRRRTSRPAATLRWLVPAVVLVSLVPDIGVGVSSGQPGTSWGAVAALMVMHVAVAAIAVAVFQRAMPAR
jgi:hypothetical protein